MKNITHSFVNTLVHGGLAFIGSLHIQDLHQRLDGDALQEDSKVDHSYCGGNKHVLLLDHILIHQQDQGEGNSTTQSTIGHHKLIHSRQLVQAEAIGKGRQ